jgi:chorismate synthase
VTFDFRNGTVVAAVVAIVTMGGTVAGVYSTLHGDLVECKNGIEAVAKRLDDTAAAQRDWNKEERATDSEVRGRLYETDKEIKNELLHLSERLDSLGKMKTQP